MPFIADFHIHSRYSRATSKEMAIANLAKWAKIKGIAMLGTGDFTHPLWLAELKKNLVENEYGVYRHDGILFLLTAEVSNIYFKTGRTRKVHNIIFAPSFEIVEEINGAFAEYGALGSDGRPILGLDCAKMAKTLSAIAPDIFIVPAHAWTPHFSIFGSNSGFDSPEECFEEQLPKIFSIETGLSCYDEKTEVLTKNGWKTFSNLLDSDSICTLNIKTLKIEFQNPTGTFQYKYIGKMYRLKTKRVDLLVTPNHNLLYSPCDFRNPKPYSLREARSLFNKSKRFKKDGIWSGDEGENFILPAVSIRHGSRYYSGCRNKKEKIFPMETWVKFFGFWIAEGWTTEGKNGNYNVCVSNQNMTLLDEMERLLKDFGYSVFRSNGIIRARDYQLFHYLMQFGGSHDKFIPADIKSLKKELLGVLLDYYLKGDGHIYGRTKKGMSAVTASIRLRDDLQEIALKVGMSAYYKLTTKKGAPIESMPYKGKIYRQGADIWTVYFIRKNEPIILPSSVKRHNYIESWVNYKGRVFCVAVPNRVIYVRRNGIPIWCGNSDPKMNWRWSKLDRFCLTSNSDAHSPAKIGREANVFRDKINYKELVDILKTKDKTRFLYTIEFFPEEGKYHWDGHRVCKKRLSPGEAIKMNNICPVCGKKITIGVMHRLEGLADRPGGFIDAKSPPFKSVVPLAEIIGDAFGVRADSVRVEKEYRQLIKNFGTEFTVLLDLDEETLKSKCSGRVAKGIINMRRGSVDIAPGYDGEYGKASVFKEGEAGEERQLSFF